METTLDESRTTPKDFFLWAGAMVTLYWSVIAFLGLMFDYINTAFPDLLRYYATDPYQSSVSWEMASLIVLFPLFVVLMRTIHRDIEKDPTRSTIWVRRWALFLTLFVAGLTMAIDLIILLTTFLQGGDITAAFVLKVAVVFLVAAAGFMHFIADFWGYWEQYPSRARSVGYASGVLIILSIVAGFFILGTPQSARQYRLDEQRVSDLQSIQSQIVSYWQSKQALPATLSDLSDSVGYFTLPMDPDTRATYVYKPTGTNTFNLCATFTRATRDNIGQSAPMYNDIAAPEKWQHGAGQVCFNRTIDPQLYPSNKPTAAPTR
jgi:type II secretory pathway pseudopilin PulG